MAQGRPQVKMARHETGAFAIWCGILAMASAAVGDIIRMTKEMHKRTGQPNTRGAWILNACRDAQAQTNPENFRNEFHQAITRMDFALISLGKTRKPQQKPRIIS